MKNTSLIFILLFVLCFVSLKKIKSQDAECYTPEPSITNLNNTISPSSSIPCVNEDVSSNPHPTLYIPDNNTPIKTIRVNIHVMQNSAGGENFQENNPDDIAYLYSIIPGVNDVYSTIQAPEWGGPTNDPYIVDSRIRFELEGIYFHQDDIGWTNNLSNCGNYCFDNYKINEDEELNIFICRYWSTSSMKIGGCGPCWAEFVTPPVQ